MFQLRGEVVWKLYIHSQGHPVYLVFILKIYIFTACKMDNFGTGMYNLIQFIWEYVVCLIFHELFKFKQV